MKLLIIFLTLIPSLTSCFPSISPLCFDEIARIEYNINCESLSVKKSSSRKPVMETTTRKTIHSSTSKRQKSSREQYATIPPECASELWRTILGEKCYASPITRNLPTWNENFLLSLFISFSLSLSFNQPPTILLTLYE